MYEYYIYIFGGVTISPFHIPTLSSQVPNAAEGMQPSVLA